MEKAKFNPKEWLDENNRVEKGTRQHGYRENTIREDVETIIQEIEEKRIDVTSTYSDWVNIGFGLADEFGELGRSLFHRVSRYHNGYSEKDCNKQFDNCIESKGNGVTIRTFFYIANQSGVIADSQTIKQEKLMPKLKPKKTLAHTNAPENLASMPTFSDDVYNNLPDFMSKVIQKTNSKEEMDILLLGTLGVVSACLPTVSGIYDGRQFYSNLYLFISAQASAGKGRLAYCRKLVAPVHKALREESKKIRSDYDKELSEFNSHKRKQLSVERPSLPPEKLLFIPANSSATGAIQLLNDNMGKGLMFETEGDTLANTFKSDYGNYSDSFRKAWQHESIGYYRKTERELVDIEKPCLSAVLSGTPKQISSLIPDAENGLFSRFIFYNMNVTPTWKNVFAPQIGDGLDMHFDKLGRDFFAFYSFLNSENEVEYSFTVDQQNQFHHFFTELQSSYFILLGNEYLASVRRLGVIDYRISMILSSLRIMKTGLIPNKMICEEVDFKTTLDMISVLVQHSSRTFTRLQGVNPKRLNKKETFLSQLPETFNRQKYLEVAARLGVNAKTAERYIAQFKEVNMIHHESHDHYMKTSYEET